jgi:DNA ligase-1
MAIIKVMRAENAILAKIPRWPVWLEPKIDGVRGYNPEGTLLARTLKKHGNKYTTAFYSQGVFIGLDGELAANDERHPDLCRLTTSAVGSYEGEPYTVWHLFDFVTEHTRNLPYGERYALLRDNINVIKQLGMGQHLKLVPYVVCNNIEEVRAAHLANMLAGYEGSCYYDPLALHKEGKSSPRHGGVLRIKDFVDCEVVVTKIVEGRHNMNEAQTNELGRTFRSSHQDNQVPNGMVGNMECYAVKNVFDLHDPAKLLIAENQVFTIAPGKMTDAEAIDFFLHPEKVIGKFSKVKFFPKGMKDAPRFGQWQCLRAPEDM